MGTELKPTLWRTARALANPDRLNLMRLVANAKGAKGVVDLANEANIPIPTASLYLRALNARGLISVLPAPLPRRKLANLANDGVVLLRKYREKEGVLAIV